MVLMDRAEWKGVVTCLAGEAVVIGKGNHAFS